MWKMHVDEVGVGLVQRLLGEAALVQRPLVLDRLEVPLEHVLGHRPGEGVVVRAGEADRPVDQPEPADARAAALHVAQRHRAAHRPADERHVLESEVLEHEGEVVGVLVEVVAAVGLVRLAHAPQVVRDDAEVARQAAAPRARTRDATASSRGRGRSCDRGRCRARRDAAGRRRKW